MRKALVVGLNHYKYLPSLNGCVNDARWTAFSEKLEALDAATAKLKSLTMTPNEARDLGIDMKLDGRRSSAYDLLTYPAVTIENLLTKWSELSEINQNTLDQVLIEARYASYLDRQAADIATLRKDEKRKIPHDLDYALVGSLSNETREKLSRIRPDTISQAQRIEGMTPSAILAIRYSAQHTRKGGVFFHI